MWISDSRRSFLGCFVENVVTGLDYTADIPDECLASIFHFLRPSDRKCYSLVCHRWFRVDSQSSFSSTEPFSSTEYLATTHWD
ncbi:hypothetical protein I3842_08G117000 [Carya illinoinensis]|uniref:F-box domain-containing protein n=1 Tax=Carya illinoinensis TaxID=32201 RepID=A0A922JC32_CARIL|nr:hypothetical protein I3842_08G117000 [Carya illinoinensis]